MGLLVVYSYWWMLSKRWWIYIWGIFFLAIIFLSHYVEIFSWEIMHSTNLNYWWNGNRCQLADDVSANKQRYVKNVWKGLIWNSFVIDDTINSSTGRLMRKFPVRVDSLKPKYPFQLILSKTSMESSLLIRDFYSICMKKDEYIELFDPYIINIISNDTKWYRIIIYQGTETDLLIFRTNFVCLTFSQ